MSQKSSSSAIVFFLLFLLLAGAGYWYFFLQQPVQETLSTVKPASSVPPSLPTAPIAASNTTPSGTASFAFPTSVPAGTTVTLDGSTSMVTINQNLQRGFQSQFPGTIVSTRAGGTNLGLEDLVVGRVDIAAISRPLNASEQAQGLTAVPIAMDQIAVVIGKNNPYSGGLSTSQVQDIFQGKIINWSQIGGVNQTLRVINRPPGSGTYQTFRELGLGGGTFGSTPNFTTLDRDATTPLLRALGNDGIGYATYAQVKNQQTVRAVPINAMLPEAENYPYKRVLYYAYKNPPNPAVQAFLGYATSPQGQQAMFAF